MLGLPGRVTAMDVHGLTIDSVGCQYVAAIESGQVEALSTPPGFHRTQAN